MFISHTYRFIFFEVPRTGSRSITRALMKLDPDSPTAIIRRETKGLTGYHHYDHEQVAKYPNYHLIAAHRNPYHRILSHYLYRHLRHRREGSPINGFADFSFADYVNWLCAPDPASLVPGRMIDQPITELLDCQRVTHWLRFEHLREDWSTLREHTSIPLPRLSHINAARPDRASEQDAESMYNAELAARIAERFASDFDYFDYPVKLLPA